MSYTSVFRHLESTEFKNRVPRYGVDTNKMGKILWIERYIMVPIKFHTWFKLKFS